MNLSPHTKDIKINNTSSGDSNTISGGSFVNHCHCHRCGWTIDIDLKTNTISRQFFDTRTSTDASILANAEADASIEVKAEADASIETKADADASIEVKADAYADADIDADANASIEVKADASIEVKSDTDLNILTYHKNVFIEMVKTFRENITMADINNEISIYKNELSSTIYGNNYLLKDFKYEIDMTLLPILQIIFINNDIKKSLSESIIQEIQDILNDSDQLMLLLMEFSIFLKILQPFIYAAMRSINGCINKFLNVRIQSNDTEEELFMIYNNQNMVLYNIFFLFSKKIANGYSNLILTTEFLELTINKKIKNIMQISRDNKYKRINLHLFQCTQCSEIFDNELTHCCPCGQTFCSKSCQIEAWSAWHKQLCPNRQLATRQCLGCMQYFSKENIFKCTRCMSAKYCSKECQRGDWHRHKIYCNI
jgi:hypothetical protein